MICTKIQRICCVFLRGLELSDKVLSVDYIQPGAGIPAHDERGCVVYGKHCTMRTDGRRLDILHAEKFHTGAGRILPANALDCFFPWKLHDLHLRF